ncbi:hypothetical protein V7201_17590 [Bacillus sp. JJ1122]
MNMSAKCQTEKNQKNIKQAENLLESMSLAIHLCFLPFLACQENVKEEKIAESPSVVICSA